MGDFTTMVRRYITRDAIFVPSLATRAIGLETEVSFLLSTGTVVLRARCIVRQTWPTCASPFHVPGILFAIVALTPGSERLIRGTFADAEEHTLIGVPMAPPPPLALPRTSTCTNIVRRRTAPVTRPYPDVTPPVGPDIGPAPATQGESFSGPTRVMPTRVELVLPANPLMRLTDGDLAGLIECSLYET